MATPTQGQPESNREVGPASVTSDRDTARAEELALAIAAKEGCMESFEQLIARLEGRLFAFLYQKTSDHHIAQDLLQSTFVTA